VIEVNIKLVLKIDEEEYPIPADGHVVPEITDYIDDMFFGLGGVTIHRLTAVQK
jgi:hypothetical protein|tara:strand:- start:508 stop:669 length:162 start_codon:yes stop_codon:yes gene_type:complete